MVSAYVDTVKRFTLEARLVLLSTAFLAVFTAAQTILSNLYFLALGYDRTFVGLLVAANQITGGIVAFPAAMILDRIGRKRAAIGGLALNTIGWTISLIAPQQAWIVLGQVLAGCGAVTHGLSIIPLFAESSNPGERTELFSVGEAITRLVFFFGSLVAGAAPAWLVTGFGLPQSSPESYRIVLVGALLFRVASMVPLAFMPSVRRRPDGPSASGERRRPSNTVSYFDPRVLIRLSTPVFAYSLPILVVFFGGALINPFINVFLQDRFGASSFAIGVVLGSIDLFTGLAALLAPLVARAVGRGRAVALGAFVSAALFGVIAVSPVFGVAAVIIVARAALLNMTLPMYRALVTDRTPDHEIAIVNVILTTSSNIGPTVAPAISGWVQDRAGFSPLFLAAIALYALAGGLFQWAIRRDKRDSGIQDSRSLKDSGNLESGQCK